MDLNNDTSSGVVVDATPTRDEQLARVEIATLAFIFAVTVVGNSLILAAILFRRAKISRMYFYIMHLSIADLVTAFFNVLPQLAWELTYRFRGGNALCKAVKFGQILGPYLSSFVLVLTAIDRYYAICLPLSYFTWPVRRARALVTMAWLLALACCAPQALIFSYQPVTPDGLTFDCWGTFPEGWGERAYVTWYSASVFLAPLLVLIFTYTGICQAIWRNYNAKKDSIAGLPPPKDVRNGPLQPRVHSIRGISRAKLKTVKLTVVVIMCYVVCSSPFISAQLWATWDPDAIHSPFWSGPTFTILTLLASLNSCVNPWVYLIFNPDLAVLVKQQLLCQRRPHPVRRPVIGGGSNSSESQGGGSSLRSRSRYTAHYPLLPPPRLAVHKSFSDPAVGLSQAASVVMIATSGKPVDFV
ncbi:oxytocin receptor-like [Neocloeon triangulifer]|uniref:oxytocin receptor-like n=1 Tax=Neocloeon triangulifer TaxID=2078957 RepID=UPI00286F0DF2|nr:oxytocin receptor-like [Neocloeon triangulifer]